MYGCMPCVRALVQKLVGGPTGIGEQARLEELIKDQLCQPEALAV